MGKVICNILLICFCLAPSMAFSSTVYVGIDQALDVTKVTGFQFDIVGVNIDDLTMVRYSPADSVNVNGVNFNGAVPASWDVFKVKTPTQGIGGVDYSFANPMSTTGILLSLSSQTGSFSLVNPVLMEGFGIYHSPISFRELALNGGDKLYSFQTVPIPAALYLLGSGLLGLMGLRRRVTS